MRGQGFCKSILKIVGWKYEALVPELQKSVIVVAPHTSNWDFIMGKLAYTALGRYANFIIKDEWMKGPVGYLLKKLGGIGVDRSKASHFTDNVAEIFRTREQFAVSITPEGTRKANPKWKKGFYHIAMKAGVPLTLVKIDYKLKVVSVFDVFELTGDEAADIFAVQQKFRGATGRNPKQFVLPEKPLVK